MGGCGEPQNVYDLAVVSRGIGIWQNFPWKTVGPTDQPEPIDPPIGSYSDYIHHRHLLLLSPKADTQTLPSHRG